MRLLLLTLLAAAVEEKPRPLQLPLEKCLELARRNTGWRKQAITYVKKVLDLRSQMAKFLPTLDVGYSRSGDVDSGSLSVSQKTTFGTTVTVTGSHSFDPGSTVTDFFGNPLLADSSLKLSVSQPLLRGAGYSENLCDLRQARHRLKVAGHDLEAKAQETIYQVKRQYHTAARLTETVKVREKAIERARFLREEAAAKLEKGMVTILDLANAEIQLADRETALVSARMDLERALDALKVLLDLPLEKEVEIEPVGLDLEELETEDEKKEIAVDEEAGKVWSVRTVLSGERPLTERKLIFLPVKRSFGRTLKRALERRPDLAASQREKKIDELERDRKRNLARQRLDLTGSYTFSGRGETSEASLYLGDESWSVGLSYTYPLGRLSDRTAYKKALLDLGYQKLVIRDLRQSIRRSMRDIFRTLEETEKNIVTYARKISAASKALESAKIRKERGKASYWEVTARESDLLNAQTAFINACLTYRQTLALLDRESGAPSGWIIEKKAKKNKEKGK